MTETPDQTESTEDMIRRLIGEAAASPTPAAASQPTESEAKQFNAADMEEVLSQFLDPRDSDSAILMLNWLLKTGRLNRVGVLDGGQGYLFVYSEPKGSSKQGYKPGATAGDRIVDKAADAQAASGSTRGRSGLCGGCFSVVVETPDGVMLDDQDVPNPLVCTAGGPHVMA